MALSAWLADPVVRYGFRRNVISGRALMFLGMMSVAIAQRISDQIEWFGIFMCSAGFILAAIDLLEMQNDGRLEQIRLAGRVPHEFLVSFLLAIAGPWLVAGLLVIVWSRLSGSVGHSLIETPAIIGAFVAAIAAGTRLGLGKPAVDLRLTISALALLGLISIVAGNVDMAVLKALRASTAPILLVLEAAALAWAARGILRLLAHSPTAPIAVDWGVRVPQRRWMLRWPGIYRGANVASNGVVLAVVLAPAILVAWFLELIPSVVFSAPLFLTPLGIGWLFISIVCREDVVSGRLDLIRQATTTPAAMAIGMTIGLWMPFGVASVVLALVLWPVFTISPSTIAAGIMVWLLTAPLPVVEGWSRLWPFSYMLPYAMAFVVSREVWPLIAVMSALQWWAMTRRFAHPGRPVFGSLPAAGMIAVICAVAMLIPSPTTPMIIGAAMVPVLIATSPLLLADHAAARALPWSHTAAIATAILAVGTARFGLAAAGAVALSAVLSLAAAFRIIKLLPGRPEEQALVRVALLMAGSAVLILLDVRGLATPEVLSSATGVGPRAVMNWALAALGLTAFALAEAGGRAAALLLRDRTRTATPRP